MGYRTVVYGRIEGARELPRRSAEDLFHRHNRCEIGDFADAVAQPQVPGGSDREPCQGQTIHFGGNFKVEQEGFAFADLWPARFERLLPTPRVWTTAKAHFEPACAGEALASYAVEPAALDEIRQDFLHAGAHVASQTLWRRDSAKPEFRTKS